MLCVYQLQIVAPLMTKINTAKVAAEAVYDVVTRVRHRFHYFGHKMGARGPLIPSSSFARGAAPVNSRQNEDL